MWLNSLQKEGYTAREEPPATDTDLDKPKGTLSSQSSSAGSAEFEIIRGPEDEKNVISASQQVGTFGDKHEEDTLGKKYDWSSEEEKKDDDKSSIVQVP